MDKSKLNILTFWFVCMLYILTKKLVYFLKSDRDVRFGLGDPQIASIWGNEDFRSKQGTISKLTPPSKSIWGSAKPVVRRERGEEGRYLPCLLCLLCYSCCWRASWEGEGEREGGGQEAANLMQAAGWAEGWEAAEESGHVAQVAGHGREGEKPQGVGDPWAGGH